MSFIVVRRLRLYSLICIFSGRYRRWFTGLRMLRGDESLTGADRLLVRLHLTCCRGRRVLCAPTLLVAKYAECVKNRLLAKLFTAISTISSFVFVETSLMTYCVHRSWRMIYYENVCRALRIISMPTSISPADEIGAMMGGVTGLYGSRAHDFPGGSVSQSILFVSDRR